MQRFVADTMSRLVDDAAPSSRWERGVEVFGELGFGYITAGIALSSRLDQPTFASSAPSALVSDYVDQGIHAVDPFMSVCIAGSEPDRMDIAEALLHRDNVGRHAVARLFHAYGIKNAQLFPTYSGMKTGGIVLMTDDPEARLWLEDAEVKARIKVAVAMFTSMFEPLLSDPVARTVSFVARLTDREAEAMKWLAEGLHTAQIAERMGVTPVTVSKHFAQARRRMGAKTREQALAMALLTGQLQI
ncbi:helix-turn-helix transcriptional regulator [Acuticoccus yangtzensis]|uniref:helix-turn-helix transcriptional regulator n=1 Tax=Acuticoccus yangtzensis TaxID=1443441 RepID=UPI0009FB484A|nr:LuxR family transcriptional regulator [Acuticoccus yangtzensis]